MVIGNGLLAKRARWGLRAGSAIAADGRVEAVMSGPEDILEMLFASAQRGPRFAAVSRIERHGIEDEAWPDFAIRPTAWLVTAGAKRAA